MGENNHIALSEIYNVTYQNAYRETFDIFIL